MSKSKFKKFVLALLITIIMLPTVALASDRNHNGREDQNPSYAHHDDRPRAHRDAPRHHLHPRGQDHRSHCPARSRHHNRHGRIALSPIEIAVMWIFLPAMDVRLNVGCHHVAKRCVASY